MEHCKTQQNLVIYRELSRVQLKPMKRQWNPVKNPV